MAHVIDQEADRFPDSNGRYLAVLGKLVNSGFGKPEHPCYLFGAKELVCCAFGHDPTRTPLVGQLPDGD